MTAPPGVDGPAGIVDFKGGRMKWIAPWALVLAGGTLVIGTATAIEAQPLVQPPAQVISVNPFGLLLDLFNAEYERQVSDSATAGVGGSFFSNSGDDYVNADLFYRFYPAGSPLEGWAFGVKAGLTKVTDAGTYFGFGFDTNWSWLLGQKDNFYVGAGFGLKRLYGTSDSHFDLKYIPTVRIINIGFAF
jgi:hypothetical protein